MRPGELELIFETIVHYYNQIVSKRNFQAFHLLLPRPSGRPPFQEWLNGQIKIGPDSSPIL